MISKTTKRFRQALGALPPGIRHKAVVAYKHFLENPRHRSLQFKKVHSHKPIYSARIDLNYHAVGVVDNDTIVWFWIGTHSEYEELLKHV